jgi:hypothetical protein
LPLPDTAVTTGTLGTGATIVFAAAAGIPAGTGGVFCASDDKISAALSCAARSNSVRAGKLRTLRRSAIACPHSLVAR